MKKFLSFFFVMLVAGFAAASLAVADPDTPGSSTDPGALQGSGNTGQAAYTNVHNGKEINASAHASHTDACLDGHPFLCDDGDGGGD